jgi:hypothetical protein
MSQKIFYPSLDAMNMETTRTTESVQIIQPPIKRGARQDWIAKRCIEQQLYGLP